MPPLMIILYSVILKLYHTLRETRSKRCTLSSTPTFRRRSLHHRKFNFIFLLAKFDQIDFITLVYQQYVTCIGQTQYKEKYAKHALGNRHKYGNINGEMGVLQLTEEGSAIEDPILIEETSTSYNVLLVLLTDGKKNISLNVVRGQY